VHLVGQNVAADQPLPPDGRIELAFDRLLNPLSILRQSFVLRDLTGATPCPSGQAGCGALVSYDPVARIVTITPTPGALKADQTYRVDIFPPSSGTDLNGLRAIDGATLDPPKPVTIEFPVKALPSQATVPHVDYCRDIQPVLSRCTGGACHGGSLPAAGLLLTSPAGVAATAVGRVAQGSNTGPRSGAGTPPDLHFGVDFPIVDPGTGNGGDAAHSWLLYKLLLALPPQAQAGGGGTDGGADGGAAGPTPVSGLHLLTWQPLAQDERDRLSDFILGREMPFPSDPSAAAPAVGPQALTLDELERVGRWISQPPVNNAPLVPSACTP
jgi:hypothetical protein